MTDKNQLLHGLKLADSEKMIKKVTHHGDFAGKILLGYGWDKIGTDLIMYRLYCIFMMLI